MDYEFSAFVTVRDVAVSDTIVNGGLGIDISIDDGEPVEVEQ